MAAPKTLKNFASICRKIVCVGRNYKDHALELNNPLPKKPLIFLKPATTFLREGAGPVRVPAGCQILHHEVELGIVIGKTGSQIAESSARSHVAGYALALDMTARDFQDDIKAKGHPWLLAKCWDTFCPISDFIPAEQIPDPQNVNLWCKVDGVLKQQESTGQMIFPVDNVISYISHVMTLEEGDVILTGTPAGVGPVSAGQTLECGIEGVTSMSFKVE